LWEIGGGETVELVVPVSVVTQHVANNGGSDGVVVLHGWSHQRGSQSVGSWGQVQSGGGSASISVRGDILDSDGVETLIALQPAVWEDQRGDSSVVSGIVTPVPLVAWARSSKLSTSWSVSDVSLNGTVSGISSFENKVLEAVLGVVQSWDGDLVLVQATWHQVASNWSLVLEGLDLGVQSHSKGVLDWNVVVLLSISWVFPTSGETVHGEVVDGWLQDAIVDLPLARSSGVALIWLEVVGARRPRWVGVVDVSGIVVDVHSEGNQILIVVGVDLDEHVVGASAVGKIQVVVSPAEVLDLVVHGSTAGQSLNRVSLEEGSDGVQGSWVVLVPASSVDRQVPVSSTSEGVPVASSDSHGAVRVGADVGEAVLLIAVVGPVILIPRWELVVSNQVVELVVLASVLIEDDLDDQVVGVGARWDWELVVVRLVPAHGLPDGVVEGKVPDWWGWVTDHSQSVANWNNCIVSNRPATGGDVPDTALEDAGIDLEIAPATRSGSSAVSDVLVAWALASQVIEVDITGDGSSLDVGKVNSQVFTSNHVVDWKVVVLVVIGVDVLRVGDIVQDQSWLVEGDSQGVLSWECVEGVVLSKRVTISGVVLLPNGEVHSAGLEVASLEVEVASLAVVAVTTSGAGPIVSWGFWVAVTLWADNAARVHGEPDFRVVTVQIQLGVQPGVGSVGDVNRVEVVVVLLDGSNDDIARGQSQNTRLWHNGCLYGVAQRQTVVGGGGSIDCDEPVTSTEDASWDVNVTSP
jgi:hypothetical protein